MRAVASLLTGVVAMEHVGIMVLAANQGLYNGFLAAYFLSRTSSSGADHG
jgi:uncharacterized membrane protein